MTRSGYLSIKKKDFLSIKSKSLPSGVSSEHKFMVGTVKGRSTGTCPVKNKDSEQVNAVLRTHRW